MYVVVVVARVLPCNTLYTFYVQVSEIVLLLQQFLVLLMLLSVSLLLLLLVLSGSICFFLLWK